MAAARLNRLSRRARSAKAVAAIAKATTIGCNSSGAMDAIRGAWSGTTDARQDDEEEEP